MCDSVSCSAFHLNSSQYELFKMLHYEPYSVDSLTFINGFSDRILIVSFCCYLLPDYGLISNNYTPNLLLLSLNFNKESTHDHLSSLIVCSD